MNTTPGNEPLRLDNALHQRVRVIGLTTSHQPYAYILGEIGTVTQVNAGQLWPLVISFENPSLPSHSMGCNLEQLQREVDYQYEQLLEQQKDQSLPQWLQ